MSKTVHINQPNTNDNSNNVHIDELREALIKDFSTLYTKRFTTDWVVQRKVRGLEIEIMELSNTINLFTQPTTTIDGKTYILTDELKKAIELADWQKNIERTITKEYLGKVMK
jgi:hypothetical protein